MRGLVLVVVVASCGEGTEPPNGIDLKSCKNTQPDPACCTEDTRRFRGVAAVFNRYNAREFRSTDAQRAK